MACDLGDHRGHCIGLGQHGGVAALELHHPGSESGAISLELQGERLVFEAHDVGGLDVPPCRPGVGLGGLAQGLGA